MLLRAAPAVLLRHPTARFVFAGEGPLRSKLERLCRHLGVEGAVDLLGLRKDVPDLMRRASLFVRPSYLEGMPLTVLEAMASGLPVVATPAGGTPEILHDGLQGYLVPVGDEDKLSEAIIRVLDDPGRAAEMGRSGRHLIESGYTWEAVVERTEQVYLAALKRAEEG